MDRTAPALRLVGVSKSFGAVRALGTVDFEVRLGEVMALLGENGAGKSTLVKMMAGVHQPDTGHIEMDGSVVDLGSPAKAEAAGIAVVQQEFSLVRTMSVAESLFLGSSKTRVIQSPSSVMRAAHPHLEKVGLGHLDPRRLVSDLSVGERQLVEIARALAKDAKVLVLDEPTAALGEQDIERVMAVVRDLTDKDHGIVFVTHKLDEVFALADRVSVLRNGAAHEPADIADLDVGSLIERIVGRPLDELYPQRGSALGGPILEVDEVQADGLGSPVTLVVRRGEVLGLAGQLGSGVDAVLEAIAGVRPMRGGRIVLSGKRHRPRNPRSAVKARIAYCSGDRKRDGMFASRSVRENLVSPALPRFSRWGWKRRAATARAASEIAELFAIDQRRLTHKVETLSGGNAQKVALGKWTSISPAVLLVHDPTVGVDIGARSEIYARLRMLANEGVAIIVASSDHHEVLGIADTVQTFYKGRPIGTHDARSATPEEIVKDITHGDSSTNSPGRDRAPAGTMLEEEGRLADG